MLLSGLKANYTWLNISSCREVTNNLLSCCWVCPDNLLIVNQKQVPKYPFTSKKSQPNSGPFASADEVRDTPGPGSTPTGLVAVPPSLLPSTAFAARKYMVWDRSWHLGRRKCSKCLPNFKQMGEDKRMRLFWTLLFALSEFFSLSHSPYVSLCNHFLGCNFSTRSRKIQTRCIADVSLRD